MIKFIIDKNLEAEGLLLCYKDHSLISKYGYQVFWPEIPSALEEKLIKDPFLTENIKNFSYAYDSIFKNNSDYCLTKKNIIQENWQKIETHFFDILCNVLLLEINQNNTYLCCLTKYGVQANYILPNKIFLRINTEIDIEYANQSIAHEIIHIAVNDLVTKFNIGWDDTERLVDLILTKTEIKNYLKFPRFLKKVFRAWVVKSLINILFKITEILKKPFPIIAAHQVNYNFPG